MRFTKGKIWAIAMTLVWSSCTPTATEQPSAIGSTESIVDFSNYRPVEGWLDIPEGWLLGEVAGVSVDRDGDIWFFHRGEHPLLEFKSDGTFLRSLLEDSVTRAHGLRVDAENNIWVTDEGAHTVTKLDHGGELLMTLGETGEAGEDESHFGGPADVAFSPNGDFFVADGHENNRVVKFDRSGAFLKTWGTLGTGQGEFNEPHTVEVGPDERLYVGDRGNKRIQIFDLDGTFIEMWTHIGTPSGLSIQGDRLYMSDNVNFKIIMMDLEGVILDSFGSEGTELGQFNPPHDLDVAQNGDLYVAEVRNMRAQKFLVSSP